MKFFEFTALLLLVILILVCLSACAKDSSKGVTDPKLVKSVTRYEIDYSTGEWYAKGITEYDYENAYPVSIKNHDNDADMDTIRSFEYEFDNEIPVQMNEHDIDGNHVGRVLYTNGVRDRDYAYNGSGGNIAERIYQYGNRDEYFTMVHHESTVSYPEELEMPDDYAEEVDSVIVTTEDGLLKKTVNDGIYANWSETEEKIWYRFMGSYSIEYDRNGIAGNLLSVYSIGSPESREKYEIKYKDGKVTEIVRYFLNNSDSGKDEDWNERTKFVFEYTDVVISPARYASMINDIITDGGTTFYIFNWY